MLRGQAANATRQLRSALVVVSQLRLAELAAGGMADRPAGHGNTDHDHY
jgi:hypothetical protein